MKKIGTTSLIMTTIKEWQEDKGPRLAAALAYYTTFSLAPLLVLVIAIAGLLGGREAAQGFVISQVEDLLGGQGRQFIQDMLENASDPTTGTTVSILGMATLIFGALGAFNELQNALNTVWDVKPKPIAGWGLRVKRFVFERLLSFSMLVGIGFLLLVSLLVSAGLAALSEFMGSITLFSEIVLQVLNFLISFGLITLLFAMIFKFIPDVEITWRNVWLGAAITAILFTLGKAFGLYLGRSHVGSSFGAAGSSALIMIWVYYSSQILFFGAEFTQVFSKNSSSPHQANEHSVAVNRKKETSTTTQMEDK